MHLCSFCLAHVSRNCILKNAPTIFLLSLFLLKQAQVAQAGLELLIFLSLAPEFRDCTNMSGLFWFGLFWFGFWFFETGNSPGCSGIHFVDRLASSVQRFPPASVFQMLGLKALLLVHVWNFFFSITRGRGLLHAKQAVYPSATTGTQPFSFCLAFGGFVCLFCIVFKKNRKDFKN